MPKFPLYLYILLGFSLLSTASSTSIYAQSGRRTPPVEKSPRPTIVREALPPAPLPMATPTPSPTPLLGAASPTPPVGGQEIDEDEVIRVSSNLIPIPATVVDAQGKAATKLSAGDFSVEVEGNRYAIAEFSRSETPVNLVMLFDNSSSQTAARDLERQAGSRFFRRVMRPIDRAAIYSVSTYPKLEQPFTADVAKLTRTIENFGKPQGATSLFDAMTLAAELLREQKSGRRVIIIVSDGADTLSDTPFDTMMERLTVSDCEVYVVQTGASTNLNIIDLAAQRRLEMITSRTGGAIYTPQGKKDLDPAFDQIAADLAQQYVLNFYAPREIADGKFHKISVSVPSQPALRVRARGGYIAPKAR